MSEAIMVALISLSGVILSGVLSAVVSSSLIKYRIDKLEAKVDSHNSYAEKFAQSSRDIAVINENIDWIKKSIKEMKESK